MLRVFSYGGGVQSTAALALAAMSQIDYRTFLFANTGDDSEHPATLRYVREVAMPFATAHGIELVELGRVRRDGSPETLWGRITKPGSSGFGLPVRMSNGAPGNRACTADFKIGVVARWLREHGATRAAPATVALGISTDEVQRARSASGIAYELLDYPLLGLRMNRHDCARVIQEVGLPTPPKSACFFCPYHSASTWQSMRHEEPELFARAVALEALVNERRGQIGKDRVYFHSRLRPLPQATTEEVQGRLFAAEDTCESGYCLT